MPQKGKKRSLVLVALVPVLAALVTVGSLVLVFPLPFSMGYFTTGDILVMLIGILFGPTIGLVAGGIGSASADIAVGFGRFAPFSLVAHGGEGFLSGLPRFLLRYALRRRGNDVQALGPRATTVSNLIAAVLGGVWMIVSYYYTIWYLYRPAAALSELPSNIMQAVIGVAVSVPAARILTPILRKTFPNIFVLLD